MQTLITFYRVKTLITTFLYLYTSVGLQALMVQFCTYYLKQRSISIFASLLYKLYLLKYTKHRAL